MNCNVNLDKLENYAFPQLDGLSSKMAHLQISITYGNQWKPSLRRSG